MTEKKREYLLNNLQLSEQVVDTIVHLCDEMLGTDKYAVWIGKESKKNASILDYNMLREIIDWAQSKKPDILSMDYDAALEQSKIFHETLRNKKVTDKGEVVDEKRIVYRCSDNKHFFYTLKPQDLKREGDMMGHCVGTNDLYRKKIRKGTIKIISLRDEKNLPHVTCEINMLNGESTQISGKGNDMPIPKYLDFITEFGTWAAGDSFTAEEKKQLQELMKLHNKKS